MKTYLGDGVYADDRLSQICLTAENGINVTNSIYLEDEVVDALLRFIEKSWRVKITVTSTAGTGVNDED